MNNIYLVMQNTDLTEGRGQMVPVAACLNENTAHKIADKISKSYGFSSVSKGLFNVKTLVIIDNFESWEKELNARIKRALQKLTIEEREVLGLI